jgi:hypothetical protein
MLTQIVIFILLACLLRLAKWFADPYLAWKKNYQARNQ